MSPPAPARPLPETIRESWRPVLLVWALLAALVVSLTLHAQRSAPPGTAFVGTFYYVDDFYNYLTYVEQAQRGAFVFRSKLATPDAKPLLVNLEWLLVGRLAALCGGDAILAYRLFGLAAALALLALCDRALARCGVPPDRRLAGLALVATGAGLGGAAYVLGLLPGERALDLRTGAFPIVEVLANPHFVAGTTLLLAGIAAFASGRRWLGVWFGVVLSLVRPYDAALLAAIEGVAVLCSQPPRRWPGRWLAIFAWLAPLGYTGWVVMTRPGFSAHANPGYAAETAPPLSLLLALGPALLLAVTAGRAWRRADEGARAWLLRLSSWAAISLLLVVARPVSFSEQFVVGCGLPLLLLAAVGLARSGTAALTAAAALMPTTAAVAVWLCTLPGLRTHPPAERWLAATALRGICRPGDLVLAPDDVGRYIGGLSPCWAFVSYGAVPDFAARVKAVSTFYDPATPPSGRAALLARVCPAHLVLPRLLPQGWLGDAPYRPRQAIDGRYGGLSIWSRDASPACDQTSAVFR